ncbi:MAG: response regulator [Hyphomicrobiaceae bacterium]
MKASKAIAGFAGHVQNHVSLSGMKARINSKIDFALAPGIDKLVNDPAAGWMLFGALIVATLVLGAVSSETSQPVALTILSVLAACGLFFLIAVITGRVSLAGRRSNGSHNAIADAWPEAGLVTTRLGSTVYVNAAFERFIPDSGAMGLVGLEAWFAGEPRASEALFRLARASERGEPLTEEVELKSATASSPVAKQVLRIAVCPLDGSRFGMGPVTLWRFTDVTAERQSALMKAGAAEVRFGLYNTAPVGLIAVGGDGVVAHMNATMLRMLGAHSSAQDEPVQLESLFSRTGAEVLRRHAGANPAGGFQCALDLIMRNGRRLPVRVVASTAPAGSDPLNDERILVVMRNEWTEPASIVGDATDPSFARQFESAPFGIATVTATGRLARANPAFSQMAFGAIDGGDARALDILCRDTDLESRALVEQSLTDALAGQAGLAPVDFSAGAKGEFGRRIYITPLVPSPGSREAAILYIVDTTEQKALEQKFTQSQKMEAIGKLAGGIAHDFNNVLTAIIGSADLMLQTHRASDASHKDIQNIKQSANRAAGLVAKLMAFSRQQTLKLEVLQLSDVVTDVRPMLKTSLGEKIDLQISAGRDQWYVKADRTQLDQVIVNFAVNARDAMPNGGSFVISTRNVSEREAQKLPYTGIPVAEYVLIQAEDSGTGMPPDVLAKIFEPFFTTKDVGKGTGLGLATVYGIVKQLSGYIFAESTLGKGTIFRVYLPRAYVENEAEFVAAKAVKTVIPADLTGTATVLIVEDEDMVRSVAVRSLTRFGYKVLEAGNGLEALEVLAENSVDIVVSDVVMPEMDGPAFLKEVRKTRPDLKIIFVSGHTNEAFKATMDENEVFAFLPKPFSLPQLVAKVKEELGR